MFLCSVHRFRVIYQSNVFIFPLELLGCGCFFSLIFKNILFFYFSFSFEAGGGSSAIGKDM